MLAAELEGNYFAVKRVFNSCWHAQKPTLLPRASAIVPCTAMQDVHGCP